MSKKNDIILIDENKMNHLQNELMTTLQNDPEYSLSVDPEKKYNMKKDQKKFITYYVQYRDIKTACDLANIDLIDGKKYFGSWQTQQEIRRINRALYQRQFASKVLTLDELGGYLSSLITDEFVMDADKLDTKEKLKVVDSLMNLIKMKQESFMDPGTLLNKNVDIEISKLSIKTINELIKNSDNKDVVSIDGLSPEENSYLSTLPSDKLLEIIDDINKKEDVKIE